MNTLLTILENELKNLEANGMTNTTQWWEVAESIDAIKNNL